MFTTKSWIFLPPSQKSSSRRNSSSKKCCQSEHGQKGSGDPTLRFTRVVTQRVDDSGYKPKCTCGGSHQWVADTSTHQHSQEKWNIFQRILMGSLITIENWVFIRPLGWVLKDKKKTFLFHFHFMFYFASIFNSRRLLPIFMYCQKLTKKAAEAAKNT